MLTKFISRIVDFCLRFPRSVVVVGLLLAIVSGVYAATHFSITSDIDSLLSKDLPWRQRGIVVRERVQPLPDHRRRPRRADAGTRRGGDRRADRGAQAGHGAFQGGDAIPARPISSPAMACCSCRRTSSRRASTGWSQGEPLIADLGQDPSLRGLVSVIEDVLIGVNQHKVELERHGAGVRRRGRHGAEHPRGQAGELLLARAGRGPCAAAAGAARLHRSAAGARLQVGRARPRGDAGAARHRGARSRRNIRRACG